MAAVMAELREEELVRRAQRQDAASQKAIYEANVQYLAAVCRRYIKDEDEVKDILQDSFITIFSRIGRFEWRGPGSLKAWMKQILVNKALMSLRSRLRHLTVSLEDEAGEVADEEVPDTDGIPLGKLQEMIRSLPDGYRTVFNLYAIEARSHKEIAAMLGISEGASFSQYSRAKSKLAKMIENYRKNGDN